MSLPKNHPAYRQPDESLTAWSNRVLALVEALELQIAEEEANGDVMQKAIFGPGGWQEIAISDKKRIQELERLLKTAQTTLDILAGKNPK